MFSLPVSISSPQSQDSLPTINSKKVQSKPLRSNLKAITSTAKHQKHHFVQQNVCQKKRKKTSNHGRRHRHPPHKHHRHALPGSLGGRFVVRPTTTPGYTRGVRRPHRSRAPGRQHLRRLFPRQDRPPAPAPEAAGKGEGRAGSTCGWVSSQDGQCDEG